MAVAGGAGYSLGLKSDGTIVAWGLNDYGQCNVPATGEIYLFMAVAAGHAHSLGLGSPAVTPVIPAMEAQAEQEGIALSWNVPTDMNGVGFLVYRRTEGADWTCVSPLLQAAEGECRWVDVEAEAGIMYSYRVQVIGPAGPDMWLGPVSIELPAVPRLWFRVSPNPARGNAGLAFALPRAGDVELRVFDAAGREVTRQAWTGLRAGTSLRSWEAHDESGRPLPSGSYWLRLDTPDGSRAVRWVLVR